MGYGLAYTGVTLVPYVIGASLLAAGALIKGLARKRT